MALSCGVLVFDGVAELDFVGPYDVFGAITFLTGRNKPVTIAATDATVQCATGLRILPDHTFDDAPAIDVLIVPGAHSLETLATDDRTLSWVKHQEGRVRYLAAVCSGAFILQKAGLLAGKKATTHWMQIEDMKQDPTITVRPEARYVRDRQGPVGCHSPQCAKGTGSTPGRLPGRQREDARALRPSTRSTVHVLEHRRVSGRVSWPFELSSRCAP
jgi:transcriptional regulator GlxA family with amidase domain